MYERFLLLASASPKSPALIDGATGAITTREGLIRRADALALKLRDAGVRATDLLAIQLPNSADFIASVLAAAKLHLVVVPIDRDAPETEVGAILSHFCINGLVYRPELSSPDIAISTRRAGPRPPIPDDAFLIKLTSGSTGKPKGVVASEGNLAADCENICTSMEIGPDDINLAAIPMSHSYGFSNLVTPLLLNGTAAVISNDYLPQSIIELANHYRCTVAPLIPMVFDHLSTTASGKFDTVRTFISAGAPLPGTTSRRFRERFGIDIHSFYGCSECGGITYDRSGGAVERGSVGAPMSGVELQIDGARLTVRSASVAHGILLDAHTFDGFENCRFVTDDLIELRDGGEVVLTGRASDMIVTASKKVNPREVEAVIQQIDGVRQVKVYGEPAGARGEVVAAAIVGNPDLTREQVRQFCRARLSLHKVPRIIKFIEAIPVDERGKVKRALLAQL